MEEGDILKVKLKDETELSYKKADLLADELKKLEDSKLIEGNGNIVKETNEADDFVGMLGGENVTLPNVKGQTIE